MASEIVGRNEELSALRAFIDGADGTTAALVLEGEAGIGKSTLWLAAVEDAHAQGWRVLASRPAQAEAFAASNDAALRNACGRTTLGPRGEATRRCET